MTKEKHVGLLAIEEDEDTRCLYFWLRDHKQLAKLSSTQVERLIGILQSWLDDNRYNQKDNFQKIYTKPTKSVVPDDHWMDY